MYIFCGQEKSNLFVTNFFGESTYYTIIHKQPDGVQVFPDGQQPLHAAPNESTHPVLVQVQVLVSLATVMVHPSELTS